MGASGGVGRLCGDGGHFRSGGQAHLPASRPLPMPAPTHLHSSPPILIQLANDLGFLYCASGPMVRSSYRAGEFFLKASRAQGGAGVGWPGSPAAAACPTCLTSSMLGLLSLCPSYTCCGDGGDGWPVLPRSPVSVTWRLSPWPACLQGMLNRQKEEEAAAAAAAASGAS